MSNKRFLVVGVVALIVVGLLFMAGSAVYRSGWSQGHMMGRLTAGGDDGAGVPYVPYGPGYSGRGLGVSVCGAGPLLIAGLLLLLFFGIRFSSFRAWKMAGGPEGEHWAEHWRRHHRHHVPFGWWGGPPSEKEGEEAEPPAEDEEAGAE